MFWGFKYYFQILLLFAACHLAKAQDSYNPEPDTLAPSYLIGEIVIEGNQKTKEKIILRELRFKAGDNFYEHELDLRLEESKINLLKQPLFNYVTIKKEFITDNILRIAIIVEERWFLWPEIAIINNDRNFNSWWETKDLGKLDYMLTVKQYNMLGLNHIMRLGISYGYTREFSAYYRNISIGPKQHHFLGFGAKYFQQQSVFVRTFNDKQESYTSTNSDAIQGSSLIFEYAFRPRYKSKHSLFLYYNRVEVEDSLIQSHPDFLANGYKENTYAKLFYRYVFDNRDSRGYPLHGNKLEVNAVKDGLGTGSNESVDLFYCRVVGKQFYQISKRFYGAHSFAIKKSLETYQPYYYKEGLGDDDYLRGFEYYVVDGQDYYLLKNTMKFELLPRKITELNFIPIKKFKKIHYALYLTSFFDIGYANERSKEVIQNNQLSNKLLYSAGIGFDMATYYDNVLRIEYSFNSIGEKGVFIHFRASI